MIIASLMFSVSEFWQENVTKLLTIYLWILAVKLGPGDGIVREFWMSKPKQSSLMVLGQWFSKCGPQTSTSSLWELVRWWILGPTPDLLYQKLWGWGPAIQVSGSPADDADVQGSLRTTALDPSKVSLATTLRMLSLVLPCPHAQDLS